MPPRPVKISASILSVDPLALLAELQRVVPLVEEIHLDICDGHLVPSLSFGPAVAQSVRRAFPHAYIDTHLMVSNPSHHLPSFIESGSTGITFHYEATLHPLVLCETLRRNKIACGIALAPRTNILQLEPLVGFVDRVLVMTVNPGFGGQKIIPPMLRKVERARSLFGATVDIAVDGGINHHNVAEAHRAGANVFVIGSALFHSPHCTSLIEHIRALTPH